MLSIRTHVDHSLFEQSLHLLRTTGLCTDLVQPASLISPRVLCPARILIGLTGTQSRIGPASYELDMSVQMEVIAKRLLMHFVPGARVPYYRPWGLHTAGCMGYIELHG